MVHPIHHSSKSLRTQRVWILYAPRLRLQLLIFCWQHFNLTLLFVMLACLAVKFDLYLEIVDEKKRGYDWCI